MQKYSFFSYQSPYYYIFFLISALNITTKLFIRYLQKHQNSIKTLIIYIFSIFYNQFFSITPPRLEVFNEICTYFFAIWIGKNRN